MRSRFFVLPAAFLLILATAALQESRGALIIFNDGFVVRGKVMQPRQVESDSGIPFSVPSGFIYVDDGARRIIFPPTDRQVAEVIKDDPGERDVIRIQQPAPNIKREPMPPWRIEKVGPWDEKWERWITFEGGKPKPVRQRISLLSTRTLQVYTIHEQWTPCFPIGELDPKEARKLLADYLDRKKEYPEARKRVEIFRFLFQAGWHDAAEQELSRLIADFPEEKGSAEPYWNSLKKARAAQLVADAERLHKTGQHEAARKALAAFFQNQELVDLSGDRQAVAHELKSKYESAATKLKDTTRYLKELAGRLDADPDGVFAAAAKQIAREVNIDSVARLETFVRYAHYHEREVKEKRKPVQTTEQVLALALTGWTRGDTAAEQDPKLARALWQLRQLLIAKPVNRNAIVAHCKTHKLEPDLVAQIIPTLPPPDAAEIKNGPVKLAIEAPDSPGGDYWVQLPPEYDANRSYPVLIVLHAAEETPAAMLGRWSALAKQHGYILAAPEWGKGKKQPQYRYTAQEHAVVLDTIRDLRRRFGVDSDRVFLYGWRMGGNIAYDVGLAHPDQFAGVLPHNASTQFFPERYAANAQYLPFYIVEGDLNGGGPRENRKMLIEWIKGGYPCIYVEYKGRGSEWFAAELPIMFDWMNRKRRAYPTRDLGWRRADGGPGGGEFKTMRDCDNRFYWLTVAAVEPKFVNSAKEWAPNTMPAQLQATIMSAALADVKLDPKNPTIDPKKLAIDKVRTWNQINVYANGVKGVTIWLGPNTIDFTKPVRLYYNGNQLGKDREVKPTLETLLVDFLHQWDRQRLFLAKIEVK